MEFYRPALRFTEHEPDPRLLPWIWRYWEFVVGDGAPPLHHVPPDGSTSLVVPCGANGVGPMMASGPWLEPLVRPVVAGNRFLGLRFVCGAAAPFLGVEAAALVNQITPAAPILGPLAERLIASISADSGLAEVAGSWNAILLESLDGREPPDALVRAAVDRISGSGETTGISLLSKELKTSERTLLRRFRKAAGITPKQFGRIHRLRRAAMGMIASRAPLSRVAAHGGYADQPHLAHEFSEFLGLTPSEMRRVIEVTRHENLSN